MKSSLQLFWQRLGAGSGVLVLCFLVLSLPVAAFSNRLPFLQDIHGMFGIMLGLSFSAPLILLWALSGLIQAGPPRKQIYGPLVWHPLSLCNLLLMKKENRSNLQAVDYDDHGVVSIRRWMAASRIGYEFRVPADSVTGLSVDETEGLVLVHASPGTIQAMTFTGQDPTWKGDYGYASGDTDLVGVKVHNQDLLPFKAAMENLLSGLQQVAHTFAEQPERWR